MRAVTSHVSATPASCTYDLVPESTQSAPSAVAVSATPAASQAPAGSAKAQVAMRVPATSAASSAACCSGVPDRAMVVGDHVDGKERTRRHQAAHLLGDQHEIEEAVAADAPAPEVGGDEHRRPTQLGAPAPEVAVEADGVVVERADLRERALGLEEPARRLDEQLLVALQLELHLLVLSRGRGSNRC